MKLKRYLSLSLIIWVCFNIDVTAQTQLDYYLPTGVSYNPTIPTPSAYLGYEVGEWHVEHDKLIGYLRLLAEKSDRVSFEVIGYTYEKRPLIHLTITHPEHLKRIEELRSNHITRTYPDKSLTPVKSEDPIVVWAGYGVHGNEPSASNSAILVAYHLAAAEGSEIDRLLKNVIVLLDPSLNPDGMNRFAHWVNTNRSKHVNPEPATREHNETWPGGRTNHYWFDLNRDWLPVQHPESQARIHQFHKWKPNIVLDFHEMGTNSTFFFQPGIPTRYNPLTPIKNAELTAKIGTYNAAGLDQIGSLYYTRESFDDYYYGKGSTYPDAHGAVGILFEQASSRGHIQESVNGLLRFPFTIKNQFVATLSSLKAATEMKNELLEYQKEFFDTALREAAATPIKAYVFGDPNDLGRTHKMASMFTQHDIKMYALATDLRLNGKTFKQGAAYLIPTNQPQYRLITSMFERRTTFTDSLFYDISSWTIPLGFDMPFGELNASEFRSTLLGEQIKAEPTNEGQVIGKSDYAYVFEWDEYYAPRLLGHLLSHGLRLSVAHKPFKTSAKDGARSFDRGTLLLPVTNQNLSADQLFTLLTSYAKRDGIDVYALSTGLVESGIDLGSPNFIPVNQASTLMFVGPGIDAGSAGELWHLLDHRFDLPVALIETNALNRVNLNKYSVIIMPAGNYNSLGAAGAERLQSWVRSGGTLIPIESAVTWAGSNNLINIKAKARSNQGSPSTDIPEYGRMNENRAGNTIPGTIFEAEMDLSHPLAFGYNDRYLSVFKANTLIVEPTENPYASPIRYASKPLLSGYASKPIQKQLANSPAVVVGSLGSGRVVAILDDPNFRAFWLGTNKLLFNAMFFGSGISSGATE
jgi:hypothetical protein